MTRLRRLCYAAAAFALAAVFCPALLAADASEVPARISAKPVGARGPLGCLADPKRLERLEITKSGVYENYLIDSNWKTGNRVKITADNVVLRHCEIRNAKGNGVGVFSSNVLIENCKIHHMLSGTFDQQDDAHGITGRWSNVTIRNCEIYYVSGDCIQFDPDRKSSGHVLIEDCTLWTGPLPEDAAGFKKGQRPGENAVDTKVSGSAPRSTLVIRNCYLYGFNQPAQIGSAAALNIKENVQARIENCVLRDNEIAFRLRGPGKNGGALVEIRQSAIYDSKIGVRMEDKIRDLKISGLAFGPQVNQKYQKAGGGSGPGYENQGERQSPPLEQVLKAGFPPLGP